jgi:predicted pyridoxine 5'-phosphate oxidase superfamily flavin-nucleotide-binding protein
MNQAIKTPNNASIGNTSDVLRDIHLENKNIAIYNRDIDYLNDELKILNEKEINFKSNGSSAEIIEALKTFSKNRLPAKSLLIQDIAEVLNLFKHISKAKTFRLSLESISTDMCRKFHADINQLRLLCTYVGSGTLWLPDDIQKDVSLNDEIQQVKTGNIALLKGKLYPTDKPLFHRSPEIETLNERRLLLRIDRNG